MSLFVRLLTKFRADESGAFAMIFGVTAIVLIALGGAVVDFVSLEQTRNRAQVALDAATLALQKDIFATPVNLENIRTKALALVNNQIVDARVVATLDTPVIDIPNGSLLLTANIEMPTIFVALVGVQTMRAGIVSEATRKMLDLEVAMVLDNSGSMSSSNRMTYLKEAAKCATNILFYTDVKANCDPVSTTNPAKNIKIGIVPFTIMVNVGTQFKDATWLDWAGKSSVARINFDDDDDETTPFLGAVDRKNLFSQTQTNWTGCVEARKAPYDTTDETPSTMPGKEDTLFVPLFTPDGVSKYQNFSAAQGDYITDTGGTCPVMTCEVVTKGGKSTYTLTEGTKVTTPATTCVPASNPVRISSKTSGSTTTDVYSLLSRLELQNRLCKYNGRSLSSSTTNYACPTVPVLPLTDTPKLVQDKITAMLANGSTNIQQGTIWGVHALTQGEPLNQAQPRNDANLRKALIIMTDGENDPPFSSSDFNGGTYFSWGFPYDGRLAEFTSQVNTEAKIRAIQDAKTLAACDTAKSLGMEVFTIGLSSPTAVKTMLTKCASGPAYAFFPAQPEDLTPTFRAIADQLAPLSITK